MEGNFVYESNENTILKCMVCGEKFDYLISGSFSFLEEIKRLEMCESCYASAVNMENMENSRKPVWHDLKLLKAYFPAVVEENPLKRRTVEIRRDDRGYEVGHYLRLRDYDPFTGQLTGQEAHAVITHILRDAEYVPEGYAALSIHLIYPNRWES